ncbi:MAG: hypothetical protein UU77_C0003G0021 [candidate division WWE3 bacterium GW2011_GWC1_41_7]|uniref:Uncharacterized protein n=4 Tax=Katanobacteria TaxID=422282 RepID=A0A0G1A7T3_UNCKA|nr:MAG: hypothetical protein UU72_C0050G0007 [candidate division WWE3 bacterium GW2011_GWB1_41_6]KKS21241.1 MAG: hypothetical protein UU80_C0032G0005 [candidate division WWE3 bacterium GW2011_GWA1_41_8]KKS21393.1 MAG: hypothetical protein UU77_C0003G0021 [candidate division WWE3 bacterium GW2011_GWC1_41_7]OGC56399.1 MAG: hypothetical protein A2976_01075 [candidate division WWE3 bacterium RIFCSPLOWO2_01_FULL_41_9]
MHSSVSVLTKKAIDASLQARWKEAIELNTLILDKYPKDLDAKIRLGRAYMQTSDFPKAKKIFKEVLQVDPINNVALKNYKLATDKKIENNTHGQINPKSLIKEPGTTTEVWVEIQDKKLTAQNFTPGEALEVKLTRKWVEFYKILANNNTAYVGKVDSHLTIKLHQAKDMGGTFTACYSNGSDKKINLLIRSSVSVFRGERQEVKPYIKRGSIEEPEMEMSEDFEE